MPGIGTPPRKKPKKYVPGGGSRSNDNLWWPGPRSYGRNPPPVRQERPNPTRRRKR